MVFSLSLIFKKTIRKISFTIVVMVIQILFIKKTKNYYPIDSMKKIFNKKLKEKLILKRLKPIYKI